MAPAVLNLSAACFPTIINVFINCRTFSRSRVAANSSHFLLCVCVLDWTTLMQLPADQ